MDLNGSDLAELVHPWFSYAEVQEMAVSYGLNAHVSDPSVYMGRVDFVEPGLKKTNFGGASLRSSKNVQTRSLHKLDRLMEFIKEAPRRKYIIEEYTKRITDKAHVEQSGRVAGAGKWQSELHYFYLLCRSANRQFGSFWCCWVSFLVSWLAVDVDL